MLGEPVTMLIPDVVGFKLTGELPEGSTATDLVLSVTELLRKTGVVGKFVEFYGEGVAKVALYNRATIGNMSPEYGSTCAIFPIDDETLRYLRFTGRPAAQVELVEAYAKQQGLWHDLGARARLFAAHRTRPLHRRAEPGRAGPAAGQSAAPTLEGGVPGILGQNTGERWHVDARCPYPGQRRGVCCLRRRPRRCRDRGHNKLHQHLQPRRHDGRRPAGQTRGRAWAFRQSHG